MEKEMRSIQNAEATGRGQRNAFESCSEEEFGGQNEKK